jgi:hypothetical protein
MEFANLELINKKALFRRLFLKQNKLEYISVQIALAILTKTSIVIERFVCVPLKVYVGTFVVGSTETPIGCTLVGT